MKTKIIAVIATTMSLFGCEVVWGQIYSYHLPAASFYDEQTNLSKIESENLDRFRMMQREGTLPRTPTSEQPANYKNMTEGQKNIFDVLYRSSQNVQEWADNVIKDGNERKVALLREKTIPQDPWRKLDGKPVYVLSYDSGFINCAGTVIQTTDGGVLVKPLLDITGDYFIKDFPYQVADGYELDASKIMAKKVGLHKFTTVVGSGRTVTELDYGEPCERPKGGETIEQEAKVPTPYEQNQLQESESYLTKTRNAASAAKKRVADFVQKIDDDKTKEKQRKDLIKETAKNKALKFNQDQADKGDSIGLQRMGERYRDGEGVPKDLNKARDYFEKAQKAGNFLVDDELKKLNQMSTNSPAPQ